MDLSELIQDADARTQVEKMMQDSVKSAVASATDALSAKNKELLSSLKKSKKSLPDGITKDDIAAVKEHKEFMAKEEERLAIERGEFKQLQEKQNQAWQEKYNELESTSKQSYQDVQQELNNYISRDAVSKALQEAKLSEYTEVLMPHLLPKVGTIKSDDGSHVAKVMQNGKVATNDLGEEISIADTLAQLQASPAFSPIFRNTGGNANGSSSGGYNGDNPFVTGNMTQQSVLMNKDPGLARELARNAGVTLPS